MKLFEYQAKELFAGSSIPVPKSELIDSVDQVEIALNNAGGSCVLKSQVLSGGRGKAGLIQFAKSADEAKEKAQGLFDKKVKKILVEEMLDIDKEIYVAITIDPVDARVLIMACADGGVDIEQIAAKTPEKIIRQKVDPSAGLMPFAIRNVLFELGLKGDAFKAGFKIISNLYEVFMKNDAELVEINPLVITKSGELIAADGKVSLDDNASYRQKTYPRTAEYFDSEIEFEAAEKGIPYLEFDGDIGLMCAGAGLTNTVYDLISDFGGTVSNYLEFGGPNYRRAVEAMELTLKGDPKVILVVTFGTIARADVMAEGIAEAIKKLKPKVPIVTAIRGTNEEKAQEILQAIGLETVYETEDAVKRAVELAKGAVK
jgi:succinyl-CoA synthetase beta subunit